MYFFLSLFLHIVFFISSVSYKYSFLKYKFIYFNWGLITLQYCIGFAIKVFVSKHARSQNKGMDLIHSQKHL